jgi:hypothetical protein
MNQPIRRNFARQGAIALLRMHRRKQGDGIAASEEQRSIAKFIRLANQITGGQANQEKFCKTRRTGESKAKA